MFHIGFSENSRAFAFLLQAYADAGLPDVYASIKFYVRMEDLI